MRQRLCHLAELTGDRLLTEHPTTGDPVLVLRDDALEQGANVRIADGVYAAPQLRPHLGDRPRRARVKNSRFLRSFKAVLISIFVKEAFANY